MRGRIGNLSLRTLNLLGYNHSDDLRESGFWEEFCNQHTPAKFEYQDCPFDRNTLRSIPQSRLKTALLKGDQNIWTKLILNASKPGRKLDKPHKMSLSIDVFQSTQYAHKITKLIFLALHRLDLEGRHKRILNPRVRSAVFTIIDRYLAYLEHEFRRKCASTLNTELCGTVSDCNFKVNRVKYLVGYTGKTPLKI